MPKSTFLKTVLLILENSYLHASFWFGNGFQIEFYFGAIYDEQIP